MPYIGNMVQLYSVQHEGTRWRERRIEIRERYASGENQRDIADKLGFSRQRVSWVVRDMPKQPRCVSKRSLRSQANGVEIVRKYAAGMSTKLLAEEYGYNAAWVTVMVHRYRAGDNVPLHRWGGEKARLPEKYAHYLDGMTIRQIAELYEVTAQSVFTLFRRHGLALLPQGYSRHHTADERRRDIAHRVGSKEGEGWDDRVSK